jgi:hypothetical protein
MSRAVVATLALLGAALAGARGAWSQETGTRADSLGAETAESFAVPESPAFTFLSASPATIARPTSVRDFTAALIDGVDERGRVRQGFALEITPFYVIPGFRISREQYMRRGWNPQYILANTQLSLGTVRSGGDSADTDLAVGIRAMLHDGGDPWRDQGFRGAVGSAFLRCAPTDPTAGSEEEDRECLRVVLDSLRADFTRRHWNAPRVALAAAHGSRLGESRLSDMSDIGDRVWALGSYPLGPTGQLIGYLEWKRVRAQEDVGAYTSLSYGGRALIGGSSFNAFYELVGESRPGAADDGIAERASSWSAGIEFRAAEELWLSTGIGRKADVSPEPDRVVVIANLRWGIAKKARFGGTNED